MITFARRTMAIRLKQIDEMLHATPSCVRARVLSPSAVNPSASRINQRGTTSRSRWATYHKVAPPTKVSTPRANCMLNCTPDRCACGAPENEKSGTAARAAIPLTGGDTLLNRYRTDHAHRQVRRAIEGVGSRLDAGE